MQCLGLQHTTENNAIKWPADTYTEAVSCLNMNVLNDWSAKESNGCPKESRLINHSEAKERSPTDDRDDSAWDFSHSAYCSSICKSKMPVSTKGNHVVITTYHSYEQTVAKLDRTIGKCNTLRCMWRGGLIHGISFPGLSTAVRAVLGSLVSSLPWKDCWYHLWDTYCEADFRWSKWS
jgi:hypothetical protein